MTSVSHGALICGSVPAFVALVALRSRPRQRGRRWRGPASAIAGFGVVLVAGGGGSVVAARRRAGAAGRARCRPSTWSPSRRLLDDRDPAAVTAVQMAAGALLCFRSLGVFEGMPSISVAPTLDELTAFVALAGLGSIVPFVLYAYGQKRVTPEVAGAFVNLEPLVGAMSAPSPSATRSGRCSWSARRRSWAGSS